MNLSPSRRPTIMPPKFIPNEQITDVLSLLPVKSLLRFRCLSKSLDSLISDPNFIKLHLTRYSRNADFTLVSTSHLNVIFFTVFRLLHNPPIIINLPEEPNHQLTDKGCLFVVGSCNGLLCLFSQFFTSDFNSVTLLRFWNPATRKMSPKLGHCLHKDMWFHPNLTFAYVNSTDTYKVVYLVPGETNVYVFSLGDNIWRTIQDSPVDHDYWINFVNLHDCISWLAIRNYSARYDFNNITIDQFVIVSLYLGTETHSQLSPPIGFREVPIFVPSLSLLKDSLCFSYDYKQTHLVVWQMKEFRVENSWIQLFNISYHNLQIYDHHVNDLDFRLLPLCLSEKSDTILLISTLESEAILYNWRHNRVERIYKPWFNGMDYVESLVSLERLYSWEHN